MGQRYAMFCNETMGYTEQTNFKQLRKQDVLSATLAWKIIMQDSPVNASTL